MRSEIQFVMHQDDEKSFIQEIYSESSVVLVNGPKWDTPDPPILSSVIYGDDFYQMIWNSDETETLTGRHHFKDDNQWWYCENEHLTIQFLRSRIYPSYLVVGRLAVTSEDNKIESRFKRYRKWIKKHCTNNALIWQNFSRPRSRTNPSKPSVTHWVGQEAMRWMEESPQERWVQQFPQIDATTRAYLVDLVGT